MSYRNLLLIVGSLPLLVAGGTWAVGERIEVAILRTFSSDGHGHDTKLWVIDHEGQPWLRGAGPPNKVSIACCWASPALRPPVPATGGASV